jgi:hypothetical protein
MTALRQPTRRMKQQPLLLKDMRATAKHWRAAADHALTELQFSPAERQRRRDYYLAEALKLEQGQPA